MRLILYRCRRSQRWSFFFFACYILVVLGSSPGLVMWFFPPLGLWVMTLVAQLRGLAGLGFSIRWVAQRWSFFFFACYILVVLGSSPGLVMWFFPPLGLWVMTLVAQLRGLAGLGFSIRWVAPLLIISLSIMWARGQLPILPSGSKILDLILQAEYQAKFPFSMAHIEREAYMSF